MNRSTSSGKADAKTLSLAKTGGAVGETKPSATIAFNGASLDMVLEVYQNLVKKTVLKDPGATCQSITIQPSKDQELSDEDKIEAIETVLEMNDVHLEPYGENFIRAVPRKNSPTDGGIPLLSGSDARLGNRVKVVTVVMKFEHLGVEAAQKILDQFKTSNGRLIALERANSILVTDTEQNINRMLEIREKIDQPIPPTEDVEYIQVKYANATEIQQVIDKIVQESMKEQEKEGKTPQKSASQTSSAGGNATKDLFKKNDSKDAASVGNLSLLIPDSDAARGRIRGKVFTIADERSNKILIITNRDNMDFFKKVIAALDVETTPDTVVKVYRLKYAEAEDVSDMINDLIGNTSSAKSGGKQNQNQNAKKGASGHVTKNTQAKKPANQRTGDVKPGELNKENTTVLSDKRINGIVVMTNKELLPTVEEIISSMDIKLSQVLIETAIIEVSLGDNIKTGVDWMRYNPDANGQQKAMASSDFALGGGGGDMASTLFGMVASNAASYVANPTGSGLNYFLKSDKLNLAAVIQASKTDARSKYIASPIVMTVDNKEATINATDMTYLLKGFTSSGNSYSTIAVPDYEQKELGIEIKVTPKINPNGTVMLTVEAKYTQKSGSQVIKYATGNSNSTSSNSTLQDVTVPTTATREMTADVLLESMQTVILGGLTDTYTSEEETGIPILKDIPVVGKWLFGKVAMEEKRKELLIFMTPYVLDDGAAAQAEAIRRKNVLSDPRPWDDRGWSTSALADPVSKKEQMRRLKDEWKKQDAERKSRIAIEKMKIERAAKLKEMSKEERDLWLDLHMEELEEERQEELKAKMLDEDSQKELAKIAEQERAKQADVAEKAIEEAKEKESQPNERAKMDAEKKEEQEEAR